jgi:hypothetical protein
MFLFILGICALALLMPVLRFLFGLAILCVFYLVFTGGSGTTVQTQSSTTDKTEYVMTYQELKDFNPSCNAKEEQLKQLKYIQSVKNFKEDPNDLEDADRAYNSRLKATIWWYTYSCDQA